MSAETDMYYLVQSLRIRGVCFEDAVKLLRDEWVQSLLDEQKKISMETITL